MLRRLSTEDAVDSDSSDNSESEVSGVTGAARSLSLTGPVRASSGGSLRNNVWKETGGGVTSGGRRTFGRRTERKPSELRVNDGAHRADRVRSCLVILQFSKELNLPEDAETHRIIG